MREAEPDAAWGHAAATDDGPASAWASIFAELRRDKSARQATDRRRKLEIGNRKFERGVREAKPCGLGRRGRGQMANGGLRLLTMDD
jgi:hypothetical protein